MENTKKQTAKNITATMEIIEKRLLARLEKAKDMGEIMSLHTEMMAMTDIAYQTDHGEEALITYCKEVMGEE